MFEELEDAFSDFFNGKTDKPKQYVPPNLQINQYAFMKKRKSGVVKPYPIRQLNIDLKSEPEQIDLFDIGGCGCFVNYD